MTRRTVCRVVIEACWSTSGCGVMGNHTDLFPDATDTRDGCDVPFPHSSAPFLCKTYHFLPLGVDGGAGGMVGCHHSIIQMMKCLTKEMTLIGF
jgi:hypothetical protein